MRKTTWAAGAIGVLAAAVTLSGCAGSSSSDSSNNGTPTPGGTVSVVQGTAPDSLDPGFGYTTQSLEATAMVYTPLLTYAPKSGSAGTELIPGLAKALPTVSSDKKTYTLQLRSGLKYSNGTPVKASDFTHAIERSCKISWGGKSFFTNYIVGAAAYDSGKASTISGIKTDDATGKITVNLTEPYGAFPNLIAFTASAPIPSSTPMKVLSNDPPLGVGPYTFGKIVPNQSYQLIKDSAFKNLDIPEIPTGYADRVQVNVESNTTTGAQQVLNNQADVFDPGDALPSGVLNSVTTQAKNRYKKVALASTYYFFLNTRVAPFNNLKARQAVDMATDRNALARLSSGSLTPACFFLPPTIAGHSSGNCPNAGDPSTSPSNATVAKAKAMIKSAGLAGSTVTVWGQQRSPRRQYVDYFASLLNELGFNAKEKIIQDSVYFQTIGRQANYPQAGFADWSQDFPNPSDFYLLLSKRGIQATNNENYGNVADPTIESKLATLEKVPATQLDSVASQWESLDNYVSQKSYVDVYGYNTAPQFTSNRIAFDKVIFNPVTYILFSTVELTK